jgi:hypothetical protein
MGQLLQFPSTAPRGPGRKKKRKCAQILFFTGVRYVRAEDESPRPARKRRVQKPRKSA